MSIWRCWLKMEGVRFKGEGKNGFILTAVTLSLAKVNADLDEAGDVERRLVVKTSSSRADVFLPFIPTQLTLSLRGSNTLYEEKV